VSGPTLPIIVTGVLGVLLCASCRAIDRSRHAQELDLTQPGVVQSYVTDFTDWDPRRGEAYVMLAAWHPDLRERTPLALSLRAVELTPGGPATLVLEHTVESVSPWCRQYLATLDVAGRTLHWTATVLASHPELPRGELLFVGRTDEH